MFFAWLLSLSLVATPVQVKPADVVILQEKPEVANIEGNTVTFTDGTESSEWFLIDDNIVIY